MKRRFIIICALSMLCFVACGGGGKEVKSYTYENLNSQQQIIIDNIYDSYSVWESVFDSGKDIVVGKINFLYEEDVMLFVTYYDEGNDGVGYFCKIMEVSANGDLIGHSYENTLFDQKEKAKERAATMAAITGFEYPSSEEEQKNVLANAFYKAQKEQENK